MALKHTDNQKTNLSFFTEKTFFILYNLCWKIAIPLLKSNPRLADGFNQRTLKKKLKPADLWIQSASAGEAYLVLEILKNLRPSKTITVLATANTRQGVEILEKAIAELTQHNPNICLNTAFSPFDKPALMTKAVQMVKPKVMVLIETELWPGNLAALKAYGSKILILNGRINEKSLKGYLLWPSLWKTLAPDKILAISEDNKQRFTALFGEKPADAMPNIKFDRISTFNGANKTTNPLKPFLQPDADVLVLGSIRSAEEPLVKKIIVEVMRQWPNTIIGLFPRHMNRIETWKNELKRLSLNVVLRSKVLEEIPPGTVILWDIFGELGAAYGMAKACFVGGSLAPLGGQNFLEAITYGLIPVIGPFWDNFSWVGKEIMDQKLVHIASGWKQVADILVNHLKHPIDRSDVQQAAQQYVRAHQGGTTIACDLIRQYLKESQQQ